MRRSALIISVAIATLVSGCHPERPRRAAAHFQVVREFYWVRSPHDPRALDVFDYTPAVGDTFGPGGFNFVVAALPDTDRAILNFPPGLAVMNGWWLHSYGDSANPYHSLRGGGDTVTVTTRWTHFSTQSVDAGSYVSVRMVRRPPH